MIVRPCSTVKPSSISPFPCESSARTLMTEQDWLACADAASLCSELELVFSERKLHLFGSACLRRIWPLLDYEAARLAVEAGGEYADGLIGRDELGEIWTNAELDKAA